MFSEREYYAAFKKVRNKFREYRYFELITEALNYINSPQSSRIESTKRQPWIALLFVKWIFLDINYPNLRGKIAKPIDVYSLLQSIHDMANKLRMPDEYDHSFLFIRNIAFQQFIYQIDFHYPHLSRQSIIFSGLNKNHYIHREFLRHTGLEIQDFLDLSLLTITRFYETKEVFLPINWFSPLASKYSQTGIDNFLNSISSNINDIRQQLLNNDNGIRPSSEHYEVTPFIEFPLIKTPKTLMLAHKNILFRRLEYFIYDIMRNIDSEKFMDKFGELFERYVEKSIEHSNAKFLTEMEIKKLLGAGGKQIDFLIQENSSNIFVDAKAVEMSAQGKTTHLTEIIRQKTKTSILKAIKQSHDVIKKITDKNDPAIPHTPNNYLLVITFKDLYLGNGKDYYELIAKEKIDEIYNQYNNYSRIPPENMYFITIDDLDSLSSIVNSNKFTFTGVIDIAKKNDINPGTRKFDFRQHIDSLNVTAQISEYLVVEKDKMFERILAAAKN